MLKGIFSIFMFQLVGEVVQKFFDLSMPGPVIGLILLLTTLVLTRRVTAAAGVSELRDRISGAAEVVVQHLSLLFIPIGVGVVLHVKQLESNALAVVVIILVGTISTIGFVALLMQWLQNRGGRDAE